MDQTTQQQFMYLFERIGEPLRLGPRGNKHCYYEFPMEAFDQKTAHSAVMFRANVPVRPGMQVQVKLPTQTPDLTSISVACPKTSLFSYFVPTHRDAATKLRQIMLSQQNKEDFLGMACFCRDDKSINPRLWVHSYASAVLRHPALKGFKMPAFWEVLPDEFIGPAVVREAQRQAVRPLQDRERIEIPRNFSQDDPNVENRLAYFREDLGVNSHHWHWHLVYTGDAPRQGPGRRDRKGELFYWMHHDMLARYDAERLANGIGRVRPHDLSDKMPEGYFPNLHDTNSGLIWGTRQENTRVGTVIRPAEQLRLEWQAMEEYRTRIVETIDTGLVMLPTGRTERLTSKSGIDVLGDIIEASDLTPNKQFYGGEMGFHNAGHVAIAFSHDPLNRHQQKNGVMGSVNTAMRDPMFYRWHKYIDTLFDKYKSTLPPYTVNELTWATVRVTELSVRAGERAKNTLFTNWMESDVDLSRGLDFRRIKDLGPIWATIIHLNHEAFSYTIAVQNAGREPVTGTFRIFMAPHLAENGQPFNISQQRLQFMQMDKFSQVLRPGENTIQRKSSESTVTVPWEQTFRDLEREEEDPRAKDATCGCGWPNHLLLPRGTTGGMPFDLYVIVTNGAEDMVQRKDPKSTEATRRGCRDAATYCGLLDEDYPDTKPMGFPFDRYPRVVNNRPLPHLKAFLQDVPNSAATKIRIIHRDMTHKRTGGAPPTMSTVRMGSPPTSPTPARARFMPNVNG